MTLWLQSTTIYRLMLYVLITLLAAAVAASALGILPYSAGGIGLQAAAFAGLCWGVNTLIARVLKIRPNIESALITGLILAAIAGPLTLPRDWLVVVVMAVAAMGSKYLLAIRRSHVFNPAALGAVAAALLLGYPASWWIGSQTLVPLVAAGGLLMMAKLRRWHLVLGFLGTYLGLLVAAAMFIQGRSLLQSVELLWHLTTSSPLLFFSFVMLIEPLTAPQTNRRRVAFGMLVGAVLFALQRLATSVPYSLELALLIGNIASRLLNPDFRQALVLRRKELLASAAGNFWFEPTHQFAFIPGQFLEYTLAHLRPDARGLRRYFSIASSPTEPQVLLTSRFSEPGSTFKQTLRQMNEGDEIVASKVAGDFVLPADPQRQLAFIAGGIGITPYRSMIKYLLDTNQSRDIVLLYGARRQEDVMFRDLFDRARQAFGLRPVYVLSQPIDEAIIRREVPDWRERLWYVSGPEPMVQSLSQALIALGVPRAQIKRDYFPGYQA